MLFIYIFFISVNSYCTAIFYFHLIPNLLKCWKTNSSNSLHEFCWNCTHADFSQRKVSILLDLGHSVSFVEVEILGFYLSQRSFTCCHKESSWNSDQNDITFTVPHGRKCCHRTRTTEKGEVAFMFSFLLM